VAEQSGYSLRKGSSSYALNGLAGGGPSVISVRIRGNWTLGNVEDRYWKSQDAGDQYVGRVLAGLPLKSPRFALLPPHFTKPWSPDVQRTTIETFPEVCKREHMGDVLVNCLAQLIYHEAFLRRQLPSAHPLFHTRLYADRARVQRLRSELLVDRYASDHMQSTGVPLHSLYLRELQETREQRDQCLREMQHVNERCAQLSGELRSFGDLFSRLSEQRQQQQTLSAESVSSVAAAVQQRLEQLGVASQQITPSVLSTALQRHGEQLVEQVGTLLESRSSSTSSSTISDSSTSTSSDSSTSTSSTSMSSGSVPPAYCWGGSSLRLLPYKFVLPSVSLRIFWQLWHCGLECRFPPLRTVAPTDFSDANQRRYLSNWRFLGVHMDQIARSHDAATFDRATDLNRAIADRLWDLERLFEEVGPEVYRQLDDGDEEEIESATAAASSAAVYAKRTHQRAVSTMVKRLRKRSREEEAAREARRARRRERRDRVHEHREREQRSRRKKKSRKKKRHATPASTSR
jgi:hypothetical protein